MNKELHSYHSPCRDLFEGIIIDCAPYFWHVKTALKYLPESELHSLSGNLYITSTTSRGACRLSRALCETKEIIILSERIMPPQKPSEDDEIFRYFIFVVLHEVAHVIKKHRSPLYDELTLEEAEKQEDEANKLALDWFNAHVINRRNPNLQELSQEEIERSSALFDKKTISAHPS